MLYVVIAIIAVAVLVLIAVMMPTRVMNHNSSHGHDGVDDEASAQRNHPPGGNTGSI